MKSIRALLVALLSTALLTGPLASRASCQMAPRAKACKMACCKSVKTSQRCPMLKAPVAPDSIVTSAPTFDSRPIVIALAGSLTLPSHSPAGRLFLDNHSPAPPGLALAPHPSRAPPSTLPSFVA